MIVYRVKIFYKHMEHNMHIWKQIQDCIVHMASEPMKTADITGKRLNKNQTPFQQTERRKPHIVLYYIELDVMTWNNSQNLVY